MFSYVVARSQLIFSTDCYPVNVTKQKIVYKVRLKLASYIYSIFD